MFGRLAVASGGLGMAWLIVVAFWLSPQFIGDFFAGKRPGGDEWFLFWVMMPPFFMVFAAVLFAVLAGAWTIEGSGQDRARFSSAAGTGILHGSAVLVLLALGGIFSWAAVDGIVTGEVIAGRRSMASSEQAPVAYWVFEALYFFLAAFCFCVAYYWRRKPRIRHW